MTRADICIARILLHEGGYVNNPSDPGGPTNMGITLATYRNYINHHGKIADLRALTQAQAITVYKSRYWDVVRADELPIGVDYAMADYAVNSGPVRAVRTLQAIVGTSIDGAMGPLTLAMVGRIGPGDLVDMLCDRRLRFMKSLETWPTFGKGWAARVMGVAAAAHRDIITAPLPSRRPAPVAPDPVPPPEPHRYPRQPKPGFWDWLFELITGRGNRK